MAQHQSNGSRTWAMGGCACNSAAMPGIEQGGRWYCEQGCAQGTGCHHAGCNCAKVGAADAGGKANTASIPGSHDQARPQAESQPPRQPQPGQGRPRDAPPARPTVNPRTTMTPVALPRPKQANPAYLTKKASST